jgi:2-oxoisovalerate dehydrogenase E1 component
MFGDFCFTAADQIAHGAGKVRHMFGSGFRVPLVMRVRVSPHTGYGSQHTADPSALFGLFPGWRIVSPDHRAFDYIGLLNSRARAATTRSLVIEHTEFLQREFDVPAGDRSFMHPLRPRPCRAAGHRLHRAATSSVMVGSAVKMAEETGSTPR